MAGAPPVKIDQTEWLLLRQLSYDQFTIFLTDVEDLGLSVARQRFRARFGREFAPSGRKLARPIPPDRVLP